MRYHPKLISTRREIAKVQMQIASQRGNGSRRDLGGVLASPFPAV
jgi:hypothetical protein